MAGFMGFCSPTSEHSNDGWYARHGPAEQSDESIHRTTTETNMSESNRDRRSAQEKPGIAGANKAPSLPPRQRI
jgi:hypothetical protein